MKNISLFLRDPNFRQALRTTFAIVLPVLVFFYTGQANRAIIIGLGTLMTALCDAPGDRYQKARNLTGAVLILSMVALSTAALAYSPLALGALIAVFCFVFSMLGVYGNTAGTIGNLALITMVFTIGLKPIDSWEFSIEIFCGGIWYTVVSLIYAFLFPYRHIEHALRDCITEIAVFLECKACFYDTAIPLETCYQQIIPAHLKVSDKQEKVRSILLREHVILDGDSGRINRLLQQAIEVIDLYEQVLSIQHDYALIRKTLIRLNLLPQVHGSIRKLAQDLRQISFASISYADRDFQFPITLQTEATDAEQDLIFHLTENFKQIRSKILAIHHATVQQKETTIPGYQAIRFFGHKRMRSGQARQEFSYRSPVFRFALRLTLLCLAAYVAMQFWLPGHYNYWLLLTIVIVARPGFSTTRKRNFERLSGSLTGVGIAFLINLLIPVAAIQLTFVISFLLGYLAFVYINYRVSVIFITMVAILGLGLLGDNNEALLWQRMLNSLLGCAAAVGASFIFPFWESRKIREQLIAALEANIKYLAHLRSHVTNGWINKVDYRLLRKQLFTSAANLSKTCEQVLAEPVKNGLKYNHLYQFQVANHQFYSAAISLFGETMLPTWQQVSKQQYVDQALNYLHSSLSVLTSKGSLNPENELSGYISKADSNSDSSRLSLLELAAQQLFIESLAIASAIKEKTRV